MTEPLYVTIPLDEFERLKRVDNIHHDRLDLKPGQVCPICGQIVQPFNAPRS